MNITKRQRVTVKFKSANPLFEQWLKEWEVQAEIKGSNSRYTFKEALKYLKKCPIPLKTGRECLILKGFGEKLCKMLDQKLQDYNKSKNDVNGYLSSCDEVSSSDNPEKLKEETRVSSVSTDGNIVEYIPIPESGEYVILLALYRIHIKPCYLGYATKQEILLEAQQFSKISFTKIIKGTKSTLWISRKTLISKNLLTERGKPLKYSLTNSGYLLAEKIYNEEFVDDEISGKDQHSDTHCNSNINEEMILNCRFPLKNCSNVVVRTTLAENNHCKLNQFPSEGLSSQKTFKKLPSTSSFTSTQSQSQEEFVIFQPCSYDIILYVDTAETTGNVTKSDPFLVELGSLLPVDCLEVRHLNVGDYIWICRERSTGRELVLPYIVERKRIDDFAGSIKDGRYHEQKFRLKRCGIPTKIYLIEKEAGTRPVLPVTTLMQAAVNTAIQDGFVVHATAGLKHTATYLSNFTKLLLDRFKDKTLMSCSKENFIEIDLTEDLISLMSFKEFNESCTKNRPMKVTDLFVKMLLQLKGMSVDKALAIVESYPTPKALRKAYMENPGVQGERLLAPLKFGRFKKVIGPSLSKTIYQLFVFETF